MRFFEFQADARSQTRRLVWAFGAAVLLVVLAVNAALALAWLLSWGFYRPGGLSFPRFFFEVNTAVTLLFVLGGWWLETSSIRHEGGVRLAQRMGARELRPSTDMAERRFGNIVSEMAIASGLRPPTPMVVARAGGINAFATGWDASDAVIAVTRGALEHLDREELTGMVAHEFSHLREGDTRLNMRLTGMVFGLEMVHNFGQHLFEPNDQGQRTLLAIPGLALMGVGWLGWVAGHALQAAVSRQREYLADARAVQWTRSREALGRVLRKLLNEHGQRAAASIEPRLSQSTVQHLLLVGEEPGALAHRLDSHPPLHERIRRIYGRSMPALPLDRAPVEPPPASPSPPSSTDSPWNLK